MTKNTPVTIEMVLAGVNQDEFVAGSKTGRSARFGSIWDTSRDYFPTVTMPLGPYPDWTDALFMRVSAPVVWSIVY